VRHAPDWAADAFCHSRLERRGHGQYGSLPRGTDCVRIIERGMPQESGR
jgi:putative acyl-CoA dehydrogenase